MTLMVGKAELSDEDMKLIEVDRKRFGLYRSEVLIEKVAEAYCDGKDGSSVMFELVELVPRLKQLKLPKTNAALGVWDAAHYASQNRPDDTPDEDTYILWGIEDKAARAVREAFAEETADRNPRACALLVTPQDPWLRRLVQKCQ